MAGVASTPREQTLSTISDLEFLKAVLPVSGHYPVFYLLKGNGTLVPRHDWCTNIDDLYAKLKYHDEQDRDVWFGCAAFKSPASREGVNVHSLRALRLDVDVGEDKPYQTKKSAGQAITDFIKMTGVPTPTIIDSGGGFHLWWSFTIEISPDHFTRFAALLKAVVDTAKLSVDHSTTTDLARVLRCPGTHNFKLKGTPRLVKLLHMAQAIQPSHLWQILMNAHEELCAPYTSEQVPVAFPSTKQGTMKGPSTALSRVNLIAPAETSENVEKLRVALNAIPPCIERKDWINILFSVKAHGFSCGEMLARKWSATCAEKYNDADFNRDWASDKGHGIGSGTVYYIASQYIKTDKQPDEGMFIGAVGDITNGREFARHFKGKLLYCHAASKWLYWDNQRWVWCDTGSQMQYAKQIADQMLEDAAKAFKQAPNDGNTKIVIQAAKSLHGNEKRLLAMLSMASSEDTMSIATPAGLDSDPWLLGVRNGTVDLHSGKLLPSNPSMLISKQCNAPFNKQATCPRFQQFMRDVFQGDQVMIDYVQRQLGYAITGQVTEEVMFFWFGRGANGKSVLVNIVAGVMGGYTGQVSPDLLRAGREAKGSAERATVRLTGLRMVLMNELAEGETWDDGKLREITSREKIAARFLYGEAFDFAPTHKLFVRGNNKPAIRDGTDGTWRRLHLVSFDRQFTENERITDLDTQILDAERDGILQWLIEGCLAWQKHGLNPPHKVRDAVQIYRKDCDVLSEWMECNCVEGSDSCADKKATYQSYKAWSDENSIRPLSGKAFSRRLSERGFKIDAGRRNYMGFKLNAIALTPMGLGQYG